MHVPVTRLGVPVTRLGCQWRVYHGAAMPVDPKSRLWLVTGGRQTGLLSLTNTAHRHLTTVTLAPECLGDNDRVCHQLVALHIQQRRVCVVPGEERCADVVGQHGRPAC